MIRILVVCCAGTLLGCGSGNVIKDMTVEERYAQAMAKFNDEDYLEAINDFTVITLQYQGSGFADKAQYHLAECRFKRGEFLLATYEYNQLKRNYPSSPLVPDAQYKLGLSYYNLAPKSNLDQQYTRKAIEELQTFVEYFPGNEHALDADAKIRELTTRLARKAYETAELYSTMQYYKAAVYYYDDVIEKYHDTEFAPLAYLGKADVLITKEKYQDAYDVLTRFLERYPNSVLRSRADRLKQRVEGELKSASKQENKNAGRQGNPVLGTGVSSKGE
jgi:outer membrane protein assembly factor BamD